MLKVGTKLLKGYSKISPRPNWYIAKSPEKKNRAWDVTEQVQLYTLRGQNTPVQDLSKMFGVSKIQAYNQIRITKRAIAGQCYSCSKVIPKEERKPNRLFQLCSVCHEEYSDYKKERRLKALEQEICPVCMENKILKGHAVCKHCLVGTYRRRLAQGLCGRCGDHKISKDSTALCDTCLGIVKTRSTEWRDRS